MGTVCLAKLMSSIPEQLLTTFCGFTVLYFCLALPTEIYGIQLAIVLCNAYAVFGLNTFLAYCFANLYTTVVLLPFLVVLILVSSGCFMREMFWADCIKWTRWLSILRWTFFEGVYQLFRPGGSTGGIPNEIPLAL